MVVVGAPAALRPQSVDLILSQAVLEHVDDLEAVYRAMRIWLRQGGYLSHEIDFRSHDLTDDWNGHWACNELLWRIARGKKPYLIIDSPARRTSIC